MDSATTVLTLKDRVSDFRDDRDWLKFDTPKNLAISISVEAAELLEHFQWGTDEQIQEAIKDATTKEQICDELADVLIYCLGFCDVLDIDVSEAILRKLSKLARKYPRAQSVPAD